MKAPFIPDNAPFNHEQKTWLAGFLAGLHSRIVVNESGDAKNTAGLVQAKDLLIGYGTQTGNSEQVAHEAASLAKSQGFQPTVKELDDISTEALTGCRALLVVISTYGQGEMPDNAHFFWEALSASTAPRLEQLNYGVLALGDTSYDEFCQAGKLVDTRLEQLGAKRMVARIDCDVDFEDKASQWISEVLPVALEVAGTSTVNSLGKDETEVKKSKWSRKNPYASKAIENRLLSGPNSKKEIRHFAFDLKGSEVSYEVGDALGVVPHNNEEIVGALIQKLEADPQQEVEGFDVPLKEVLQSKLEIMTPPKELVTTIAERVKNEELSIILEHGDKEGLDNYLWGKDVFDLLELGKGPVFSVNELAGLLKPLQYRAYSISSSPKAHPGEVHLTVAAVRWQYRDREHRGVCSTYLADMVNAEDKVGIFMMPNKNFKLPQNTDAPVIMVGPGTGIAPFRAFLEERKEIGAQGKNWLFFGDQHREHDFIYREELEKMHKDGTLTHLDLAFSRDQAEKVYVQSEMKKKGKGLYAFLEEGAYFYVCGDAVRMAKDVDEMLHEIVMEHGSMSREDANAYVDKLKKEKRYLRDVY